MKSVAVLLAGGENDKGGIDRVTEYMLSEMTAIGAGHDFVVQRTRSGRSGLSLHLSVIPKWLEWVSRIIAGKIGIAHVNVAPRGSTLRKILFAVPARAARIPVVLHLHGSGFDGFYGRQSGLVKAAIRKFFKSAGAVVVLGDYWEEFVVGTIGVARERVVKVSNGVPDPGVVAQPDRVVPRILFAGLVGERKGVDILLEALRILKDRGHAFTCDICGNGEVETYSAIASQKGLDDRVVFHGWKDMAFVRSEMGKSDVFVLPSRAENQPVAILEAMAVGLPVVASNVGAIPEQVAEGRTGFLVDPANAPALAEAMAKLLEDPALRQAMGAEGRTRWRQMFSSEHNARLLSDVYRKLSAPSR